MRRATIIKSLFSIFFMFGLFGAGCDTGAEFDMPAESESEDGAGGVADGVDEELGAESEGAPELASDPSEPAGDESDPLVEGLDIGSMSGNLRTFLTDAPGDFDEVWVQISRIEIHQNAEADSKWLTLVDEVQKHDLLTLQDAVTTVLGDAHVEPGSYSQLRMIVDHASVVVDGQEHDLFIPSGAKTGIKINLNFVVEPGKDYVLVLDFDAAKSIKQTGKGYLMEPVIAVEHIGYIAQDGEIVTVERREGDEAKDGEAKGDEAKDGEAKGGEAKGDEAKDGEAKDGEGKDAEDTDTEGAGGAGKDAGEGEVPGAGGGAGGSDPLVGGMDVGGMSGNVRTFLTDAPGDFDEVWVQISRIEIHQNAEADSKWLTLVDEVQKHDLLTLQDAVTAVLGDAHVEPGSYSQLRMIVDHASVVVDGQEHDLFIPSGAKTGIKINLNFVVEPGKDYVLVLDFDAAKSIKQTGKGYLMEPVIAVEHIGYFGQDGEIVTVERRGDGEQAEGEDGEQAEGEDGEQAEGEDGEQAEGEDGEHAEGEDGAGGDLQKEGDGGLDSEPTGGGELEPESMGDAAREAGQDKASGKGGDKG